MCSLMYLSTSTHGTWPHACVIGNFGEFDELLVIHKDFPHQCFNRYGKTVCCLFIDLAIFAKNSLTNNFYRYCLPIISPTKVFPYTAIPSD